MSSRTRLSLFGALACLGLFALAAPAAATIGITEWDGAALDKPPGYSEHEPPYEGFVYKPSSAFSIPPGVPATQAGAHPDLAATAFSLTTTVTPQGQELPSEELKDAVAEVPPGLIGNPQALPRCPISDLRNEGGVDLCPPASQVGVARLRNSKGEASDPDEPYEEFLALYNLIPPPGLPALLGFQTFGVQVFIVPRLRSDGDYGLTLTSLNANQTGPYKGFTFEIWGVPADPSHDLFRDACLVTGGAPYKEMFAVLGKRCPSNEADAHAFLTLPTACAGPLTTNLTVRGWGGGEGHASFISHDTAEPPNPIGIEGCDQVPFEPTLEARPTTNVADSPSGLDFDLHIPQGDITDPEALATAHLRDTTLTLPEGIAVNPSGANGLAACSAAEAGLLTPIGQTPIHFSAQGADCPDAAKIGRVEVTTPLLDHPVPGALYIAAPHDNPFDSLLALYIAIDDPASGTHATLAGEVGADPQTGQLTTTVSENPQLPLEDVRLHLKEGAHAPLRTPPTCGTYTTTSSLTPWTAPASGPPATPSDTYQISQGPGGSCATSPADLPSAPDLDAGTVEPIAGHYSPLVIHLRRADGSQQFSKLSLSPPSGLLAKLAGTAPCPDSALAAAAQRSGREEQASPSCPEASKVGSVFAAAGAGPAPYNAPGTAYLAGPYKGAPLSLAVIAPAVAGPFDLGTIVVRTALAIDPATAAISAETDPLPEMLQGIPLDIRSVSVHLDRPSFTLNGTSCDPLAFAGSLTSTLGLTTPLSDRFQLAECTRLPFKPKLTLAIKGPTRRTSNPRLIANLTAKPGEANIARTQVRLPKAAFIDNSHIGTVCTRVQFAAQACPAGSVIGHAWASTPLLDYRLQGNIYLRSSSNPLPDVLADLRGPASQPLEIALAGKTDSIKGALRSTFEAVPDAPVTKFHLELLGGRHGLIELSSGLCKNPRASVRMLAQNGRSYDTSPLVRTSCKKGHTKKHKRHRGGGGRR